MTINTMLAKKLKKKHVITSLAKNDCKSRLYMLFEILHLYLTSLNLFPATSELTFSTVPSSVPLSITETGAELG